MTPLDRLLDTDPTVVAVGADLLAAAVEEQGATVHRVDWRPPVGDSAGALATLAAAGGTFAANRIAVDRLLGVRPVLADVGTAGACLPGVNERTFLHAGPPVDWKDASGPLRGALIGALLYEGLADSPEEAEAEQVLIRKLGKTRQDSEERTVAASEVVDTLYNW